MIHRHFGLLAELTNLILDFLHQIGGVFNQLANVILTLSDSLTVVGEPRTALLNNIERNCKIDDFTRERNALAVKNIEFCHAERRCDLVFYNFALNVVAVNIVAILELLGFANVDTNRCEELERATAGRGFGIAVNNANLFTNLVNENNNAVALGDNARELAHCLRHHSCLHANHGLTHIALDFLTRNECGYRVDNDCINGTRTSQSFTNFECIFSAVGLRHEKLVDINAKCLCINGVECVLGIDECRGAARLLHLCENVQCNGGFTRRFRAKDFDDTSARNAANTKG